MTREELCDRVKALAEEAAPVSLAAAAGLRMMFVALSIEFEYELLGQMVPFTELLRDFQGARRQIGLYGRINRWRLTRKLWALRAVSIPAVHGQSAD